MSARLLIVFCLGAAVMTGCGNKTTSSPDEFTVLPSKPLEQPTTYNTLPTPTQNDINLANQRPISDAVVALGGNAAALNGTRSTPAEAPLIAAVSRNGVTDNIRTILANESATKRKGRNGDRFLYRLTGRPDPKGRGSKDAIDPELEAIRLHELGIKTPFKRAN